MHTVRGQFDYFQRVIPLLWDNFTIYAIDLPGMGWSDIVPGAQYYEAYESSLTFTLPVFPSPVAPGWHGHPRAFPTSSAPHRYQQRTS